ncbi:hypothetical protein ERC79_10775 [Rhodococcus sp. ABRD24]|nr:hypothetical protein ERC79_10775 [Rhodococcus sp. ABRD24]
MDPQNPCALGTPALSRPVKTDSSTSSRSQHPRSWVHAESASNVWRPRCATSFDEASRRRARDKASGIVNDPTYIVDLIKRVTTVAVETTKIVDSLA